MSASPASTLFNNLSALLPEVSTLLLTFAGAAGIALVGYAGYQLYANQSGKYPAQGETGAPFWCALSGTILVNAALSSGTVSTTLLGDSPEVRAMIGYSGGAGLPAQSRMLLMIIVAITQVFGLVFWLRGVLALRKLSTHDVTAASVFARIIGGTLMMHIVVFVNTIGSFVGFGSILD